MTGFRKFLIYATTFVVALCIGSLLGTILGSFDSFWWLNFTPELGFEPRYMNFYVFDITLGFHLYLTVGHIIMIIVAIFIAPKIITALTKS